MLYLTMHSTHFIMAIWCQHMVKDYSDNERGNPLPPLHDLLFPISSILYASSDGLCYTSCEALIGKRNSAVDRSDHPSLFHVATSRFSLREM